MSVDGMPDFKSDNEAIKWFVHAPWAALKSLTRGTPNARFADDLIVLYPAGGSTSPHSVAPDRNLVWRPR